MSQEHTFLVQGLDCANCARSVETAVAQLDGVQSCTLNFTTEKMTVTGEVARQSIMERVQALGYQAVEPQAAMGTPSASSRTFLQFLWQRTDTRFALLGAVLILPGVLFNELLSFHHPLFVVTSLAALLAAGVPIARSAVRTLVINREISINLLMTIASVGAVIIGAYTEAGMVMVLFAIGEALEGYTASRTRDSIRSLMEVVPNMATLLQRKEPSGCSEAGGSDGATACGCGEETCATPAPASTPTRVPIDSLQVGDIILVKPGERIPMDGRVVAGVSSVNQAPITGESRLIEKAEDAEVFASSINGEGTLEIEVTSIAADNTISRLIKMVEEAQEKRAPVQRFVDRFARFYTPVVVVLALLVAAVPPLFFGQPFWNPDAQTTGWLYRALAMLVVACPCALVISTPVSLISAISSGARNGVLIKGGAHLETLSRIKAIAFDKTGTITEGKPSVVGVRSVWCNTAHSSAEGSGHTALSNGVTCDACDTMIALAGAIEQRSEHPLAEAVVNESVRRGVANRYPVAERVTALTGRGVTGTVQGQQMVIGSHRYFADIPHSDDHCQMARDEAARGYTPMLVSQDGAYLGTITVADTVRPKSREAIDRLRKDGLSTLVMLTGDNHDTARAIAEQVGIAEVRAELLPEHKVQALHELRERYGTVAMIGDGINDAPALATADVGIALGGASGGTAQAMETADMTLMGDDLRRLSFTYRLSRAAMRTIHANVALSIGMKVGFLLLVLAGMGTMWMAVLADMGTSLLVTLNGMRLLRRKDD